MFNMGAERNAPHFVKCGCDITVVVVYLKG